MAIPPLNNNDNLCIYLNSQEFYLKEQDIIGKYVYAGQYIIEETDVWRLSSPHFNPDSMVSFLLKEIGWPLLEKYNVSKVKFYTQRDHAIAGIRVDAMLFMAPEEELLYKLTVN